MLCSPGGLALRPWSTVVPVDLLFLAESNGFSVNGTGAVADLATVRRCRQLVAVTVFTGDCVGTSFHQFLAH